MEIPLTFFAAFFAALTPVNGRDRQSLTFHFDPDLSCFLPNTSDYYIAELRDLGLLMCVSRCVQQRPTCRGVFSNDVTGQCKLLNVPPLYAFDGAADFSPAWNTWQVDESADIPGCFRNLQGAVLSTEHEVATYDDMNPNGRYHCRNMCPNHMTFFGVQGSHVCVCGEQIHASSFRIPDSYCSVPCNGNPEEMCGGESSETFVDRIGL